ncbi:LamG domain-containing protein [Streptomyces filamentosus]|nr:LamG domain-containing protein [Streptomyces filamentosus]
MAGVFLALAGASLTSLPASAISPGDVEVPSSLDSRPASEEAQGKAFWEDDSLPAPSAEQKASRQAVTEGRSVEVASLTSETNRVLANSDGTFTLESSPVAERVLKNGAWTPIDTDLVRRADGSLEPKAAQDITLSGGGSAPLATITSAGKTFELGAPWLLPAPRIAGSSAVYESVKPDVDLVVNVRPDGFTHHLVVHTREAAVDPALRSVVFPVKTRGLTIRTAKNGTVSLVGKDNRSVFDSGAALMWDSAQPKTDAIPSGSLAASLPMAEALEEAPENAAVAEPGVHTAEVDVTMSDQVLAVTPDQAFLTDPDTTYPVVIDPPVVQGKLTGWTALWSNLPYTSFWRTSHALGVGYDAYVDNKKVRSLFQFDTRAAAGKKILDASFTAYEIWSANCDPKTVDLYRVNGISKATTDKSQPPLTWNWVSSRNVAKGHSSACPDGDVEFDATPAVSHTAGAGQATTTLGLRASESDPLAWKQFMSPTDPDMTSARMPRLSITYVSKLDDPPRYVKLKDPNLACSSEANAPLIRDLTPRLTATPVSDEGAQASLRPSFDLYDHTTSTKVATLKPAEWNVSGVAAEVTTPTLVSGHTYSFYAENEYRYTFNGTTSVMNDGPFGGGCFFKVDVTAPPKPVITSSTYPACGGTSCEGDAEKGGVGMPGLFTIQAGANDVRRYDIWFNGVLLESKVFTANTSSYQVTVVPEKRLSNVLRVQTYDAAGNRSAATDYLFKVARGSDPVATWSFDENTGTTAANSSGTGHILTLNKASWAGKARVKSGLEDASSTANATTPAVLDTTKSFTVAAWVKLESKKQTTVVTQMGKTVGAFQLYYSAGYDRWVFNRYATDEPNTATSVAVALSDRPPVVGAWTHVMGVYDSTAKEIRLYINGVLNAETAFTTPWASTGALDIGKWGVPQLWGDVDHVQVWKRAVFPSELAPVVNVEDANTGKMQPALLANWLMDEADGATVAADASGSNRPLTLSPGGVAFMDTGDVGHANVLLMDETLMPHGTANVPVDVNGSFTLAGWFDPSHYGILEDTQFAHSLSLFSLPGAKSDAVRVWYRQDAGKPTGSWNFGLLTTDTLNATGSVASFSKERPSGWVHVTAVYNAPTRSLKMYLSGQRLGSDTGVLAPAAGAFQPTGPLNVGRSRRTDNGEFENHLSGLLDDVRVYAGVLSDQDIVALATVSVPPEPVPIE